MFPLTLTTYSNGKNKMTGLDLDDVVCEIETILCDAGIRYYEGQLQTPKNGLWNHSFCYFDHEKGCIKAKVSGRWYTWYVSNDMSEVAYDRLVTVL